MSIVYPLTAPVLPYPVGIITDLAYVSSNNISPFTKDVHGTRFPGEQWVFDVQLPPMERDEAEEWIALHSRLRGSYGTFLYGPKGGDFEPRGIATGTPLVKGAGQTGYELITDGWTPNKTGILKKGDWVQLGTGSSSNLRKLELDADSNGSGEATLTFSQYVYLSPADNSALVIEEPVGVFKMVASNVTWSLAMGMQYGYNFKCFEIPQK